MPAHRCSACVRWPGCGGWSSPASPPALKAHLLHLSSGVGDPAYDERTWLLFREALVEHPREIRAALDRPVQQHQPGRAAALLSGLGCSRPPACGCSNSAPAPV
jgi:hypothetical protein